MKSSQFLAVLACSFLLLNFATAAETKYVGSLSGIECTACKRTIAQALSKLDGVKTIRIVKQGEKSHRLEVITDGSRKLTKSDADKALAKAEHYKILSWRKS
ncbi:MAG: hypothetical protein HKN23_14155 [Verrucomicrobiales bacterium]|nr:hypothetical protein [Verrucomicrobiales bacterium]